MVEGNTKSLSDLRLGVRVKRPEERTGPEDKSVVPNDPPTLKDFTDIICDLFWDDRKSRK